MTKTQTTLFVAGMLSAIAGIALLMFGFYYSAQRSLAGEGPSVPACTVTQTKVAIGHQVSTEILSAKGRRAWANIQQPVNATNTVAVSIDEGTDAVIGTGIMLTPATTTSPVPSFQVGLDTDIPYTGIVEAITSTGSSTIQVTECIY